MTIITLMNKHFAILDKYPLIKLRLDAGITLDCNRFYNEDCNETCIIKVQKVESWPKFPTDPEKTLEQLYTLR